MRCVAAALVCLAVAAGAATPAAAVVGAACFRAERRLDRFEGHALERCGSAAGCTPTQEARHARLERRFTDRCVALNQVQVLGTHNSYHVQPRPELLAALLDISPVFEAWEYTHRPLGEQLDLLGVRQVEIDVYADPAGGLFAERAGLAVIGLDPTGPPDLLLPGMKVLHVQDLDFETTCLSLIACLDAIRTWSDVHPSHLPVMILIEAKDDPIPDTGGLHFAVPVPFGPAEFDALDVEIRSVFPPERLITPDDVRRGMPTLEAAVLGRGWPSLRDARGKVLFALDNGGAKRDAYRAGHPSLAGRVLFTDAEPGDDDAAFVKENDPLADPARIPALVAAGYIVRTRADADTVQARSGDTTQRDAALASGAQFVSTDYPEADADLGTGYVVQIPDGAPARCNPVSGPAGCRTAALEPLP